MKEVVSATNVKTEDECVKNSGRGGGGGECSGMPTPPASTVEVVLAEPMAEFDEVIYSLHYFHSSDVFCELAKRAPIDVEIQGLCGRAQQIEYTSRAG